MDTVAGCGAVREAAIDSAVAKSAVGNCEQQMGLVPKSGLGGSDAVRQSVGERFLECGRKRHSAWSWQNTARLDSDGHNGRCDDISICAIQHSNADSNSQRGVRGIFMGLLKWLGVVIWLSFISVVAFGAVTTPNMGLQQPTIGVDSGLAWETDLNANSSILDLHNHTPGNGTQIPPAGLNINSALTFNNQQATNLQAVVFTAQATLATLSALYEVGPNLYYNDGSGNVIQITSGGTVNATSSGITSGTATASFVSSVLTVNFASNTPANIKGGSLLLGNNSAGSNYLTLSPPNAI